MQKQIDYDYSLNQIVSLIVSIFVGNACLETNYELQ